MMRRCLFNENNINIKKSNESDDIEIEFIENIGSKIKILGST